MGVEIPMEYQQLGGYKSEVATYREGTVRFHKFLTHGSTRLHTGITRDTAAFTRGINTHTTRFNSGTTDYVIPL
jgi:hypothetical protein